MYLFLYKRRFQGLFYEGHKKPEMNRLTSFKSFTRRFQWGICWGLDDEIYIVVESTYLDLTL